jgi:hypothetical protein
MKHAIFVMLLVVGLVLGIGMTVTPADATPGTDAPTAPLTSDPVPLDESCGDGQCQPPEDCNSCPQDCGDCCGNGRCEPPEDCDSCSQDCC